MDLINFRYLFSFFQVLSDIYLVIIPMPFNSKTNELKEGICAGSAYKYFSQA